MPICPDCRETDVGFEPGTCPSCGWEHSGSGSSDFLSRTDRAPGMLDSYRQLYDRIAADDLAHSIQPTERLDSEAEQLLRAIGRVGDRDVCDIGVGQGFLVRAMLERGARSIVAVDLAQSYLDRLPDSPRLRAVLANAENLPFRDEFDVVIASDVLEHVLNPADFLACCVEALRPDGRLVLKVPYRENLSQYRTHAEGGCPYPMVHLRTFDRSLLAGMVRDAGLTPRKFTYAGFYASRLRPQLRRLGPLSRLLEQAVRTISRDDGAGLGRIDPRLARLLTRAVTITVVAERPPAATRDAPAESP